MFNRRRPVGAEGGDVTFEGFEDAISRRIDSTIVCSSCVMPHSADFMEQRPVQAENAIPATRISLRTEAERSAPELAQKDSDQRWFDGPPGRPDPRSDGQGPPARPARRGAQAPRLFLRRRGEGDEALQAGKGPGPPHPTPASHDRHAGERQGGRLPRLQRARRLVAGDPGDRRASGRESALFGTS